MSSILKVDQLQDSSGNNIINESSNTITIGKSGDTVNLASGATAGFGKVLQVLFNNSNNTVSTTSQSYVTSNQSLSITPSSTSSKILILFNCTVATLSANTGIEIQIRRGGNAISDFDTGMYTAQVGGNLTTMGSTSFLDTPNTTSATTYEVFFKETALAGTVNLSKRRLHLMEIGA